jgi:hypothetical protein
LGLTLSANGLAASIAELALCFFGAALLAFVKVEVEVGAEVEGAEGEEDDEDVGMSNMDALRLMAAAGLFRNEEDELGNAGLQPWSM